MSVVNAQEYFELMDNPDADTEEVLELFADDAVFRSPRKGVIEGKDELREFYADNAEFFVGGVHNMADFHADGSVVVCEGTMDGETAAGREFEGVGLVDIMEFNEEDKIEEFRAYLDYSAILSEVPEDVPTFREV